MNPGTLKSHTSARQEALVRDVAYALRQMRQAPGVALLAIVCLGLGIGVNTAIFGVVNAVLLRPLAVVDPERLVLITRGQGEAFSYADYITFRDSSRSLAGVAATMPMESDLHVDGDADLAVAEVVSGNYGQVVGVPLTLGRWFTQDDELSAVISDAVWEHKFQRAADVLGRAIGSESQFYTIVGVARPAFGGTFAPMRTDLWVPVRTRPRLWARLEEATPFNMLMVFGRLDEAVRSAQAAAELTTIDAQINRASSPGQRLSPIVADVVHGQPNRTGRSFARLLTSLLGAVVGVVLLIACANVSHLLLARGSLRRREFAMRRALGASRARLVQQLLVEAVLLALGGAAIGIVLATWTSRLLQATLPASIAVFALAVDVSLDWRGLVFTSVIAVVAAVASGLWPALRTSDVRPDEAFKGHIVGGSVRRRPVGVIAQVAMSTVLLFVAASFLNGLDQLQRTAPGFEVGGRLYAHTAWPSSSGSRDARHSFYAGALERLRSLPGVERLALTSVLPLIPSGEDCVSTASGVRLAATSSEVSPDYFGTLGIPLISGQDFSPASLTSAPAAVIVNKSLVRLAWPNESPIGKSIDMGCDGTQRAVITGVVGDTAVRRIGERPSPHVYRQIMREAGGSFTTIVLSVDGDPAALTRPVRDVLVGLGQGVRVYEVQPLAVPVEQSYAAPRWLTRVLAVFGLAALGLAAVGLFGHTAHRVSRQTQEIGVRMALGARRGDVFHEVLRDAMVPVLVGIAIGEVVSLGLTGLVASVLDGTAPAGWSNHLFVGALWIVVAAFACCLPAARASGVDPLAALRHE